MLVSKNQIVVCCRVRPLVRESDERCIEVGSEGSSHPTSITVEGSKFEFDHVFDVESTQENVYDMVASPLLDEAFKGINCTLFTYGQTSSGKTHTLQGSFSKVKNIGARGILPRVAESIFCRVEQSSSTVFEIRLSVMEIYQEKLRDLLSEPSLAQSKALRIREQSDGAVWVEGLTEIVLHGEEDFTDRMGQSLKRRTVADNNVNQQSSRSHMCCIITVRQSTEGLRRVSKIHLIDLAGSEMVRKTDATGARMQEAKYINKSLSALGNVIYALTAPTNGSTVAAAPSSLPSKSDPMAKSTPISSTSKFHIPYRDSKLTRILQDSLSGNSKIVLILAVASAREHASESVATLRFGERARQLKVRPRVNAALDETSLKTALARAEKQIYVLTETISELQCQLNATTLVATSSSFTSLSNHTPIPIVSTVCSLCTLDLEAQAERAKAKLDSVGKKNKKKDKRVPSLPPIAAQSVSPSASASLDGLGLGDHGDHDRDRDAEGEDEDDGQSVVSTSGVRQECEDIEEAEDKDGWGRCAVCGLNDEEAEALRLDTSETLGPLFLCDGNCGSRFHVRCVGLVGDAGQFVMPEGEWLCCACSCSGDVDYEAAVMNEASVMNAAAAILPSVAAAVGAIEPVSRRASAKSASAVDRKGGSSSSSSLSSSGPVALSSNKGTGKTQANSKDTKDAKDTKSRKKLTPQGSVSVSVSSAQDPEKKRKGTGAGVDDSVTVCLSARDEGDQGGKGTQGGYQFDFGSSPDMDARAMVSHLTRYQAEYHVIRRERNRVLAQWQQEQRVQRLLEAKRLEQERAREVELVAVERACDDLRRALDEERAECSRLRAANSGLVAHLSTLSSSSSLSSSASPGPRARASTPAMRMLNSSLRLSGATIDDMQTMPALTTAAETTETKASQLGVDVVRSPTDNSSSTEGVHGERGLEVAARKSGALAKGVLVMNGREDEGGPEAPSAIPKPWMKKSRLQLRPGLEHVPLIPQASLSQVSSKELPPPHQQCISPIRPTSRSGSSGANTVHLDNATESSPKGRSDQSQVRFSFAEQENHNDDDTADGSTTKSKFLAPLKTRLKGLLQSVQEEADTYAEIRQKFKDREEERLALKSRGMTRKHSRRSDEVL